MAFRTTFSRLARHDVGEHLAKVWKAHTYTEGQVIRQLSPFEQNIAGSFFKSYPAEVMKNAKEFAVEILPAFLVLYGIKAWAQNEFEQINFHHRD